MNIEEWEQTLENNRNSLKSDCDGMNIKEEESIMYNNVTCEPQKEITLGQIIKDSHENLCEIEAEIDEIGYVLFGTNRDELKESDPSGMVTALAYDVNKGKGIIEKLNYIINRLR